MNDYDLKSLGDDVLNSWKKFTEAADKVIENYKALIDDIDNLDKQDD